MFILYMLVRLSYSAKKIPNFNLFLKKGSEYNRDKPISPNIIDVQRVEAIQNFNSFQSESLLIQFSSLGKINRVAEAKNSGL